MNLADNNISDKSMEYIAGAAQMHHLEEIILYGNTDITGQTLFFIAKSNFLKRIRILDLHATSVDDDGVRELMKSQNCRQLQKINLSMSWKMITNKSLYDIAQSKYCKNMKELLLQDCRIGDQGVDELS